MGAVLCGTLHTVWYPSTQVSVIADRQQLATPPLLEPHPSPPQVPQEAAQHTVPVPSDPVLSDSSLSVVVLLSTAPSNLLEGVSSTPTRQNSPT